MAPGDIPGIDKGDPLDPPDRPDGSIPPLGPNDPPQPVQEKDKPKPQPKPTPTGMELTLVGSFPNPFTGNPTGEKDALSKGLWFPSTDDFRVVVGSNIVVTDALSFLLEIMKANKPITRLNFFSHSKAGLIAMEGTIDPAGTVSLGTKPNSRWTQVFASKAIMDPYAKTWGDAGENSGSTKITVDSKTFSLDDVRAKFAPDAVLWLYLCKGASDPRLFAEVANTFQVTTKGFSVPLVYCAPTNFPADRHHTVNPQTTPKEVDSCPTAVADFHKLDAIQPPTQRTATPQKP